MPDEAGNISGSQFLIKEFEKSTKKTVWTKEGTPERPGKVVTFVFPTSEQLDADAKSGDASKADLAKKLKRFEARFDEALDKGLSISVDFNGTPTKNDKEVAAKDITSVSVWR